MMAALRGKRGKTAKVRRLPVKVGDADILKHKGLVTRIASRYARRHMKAGGIALDDLVAEGNIGLLKALRAYNPSRGAFSTYATPKILNEVKRAAEAGYTIRTPERTLRKRLRAGRETTRAKGGYTLEELGRFPGGGSHDPTDSTITRIHIRRLKRRAGLNAEEQRVLNLRYDGDRTLQEAARAMRRPLSHVYRVERSAYAKLRKASLE